MEIRTESFITKTSQVHKLQAYNDKGEAIFGADCTVYKSTDLAGEWRDWEISWGTTGAGSLEEKTPHFEAIKAGFKKLKTLQKI